MVKMAFVLPPEKEAAHTHVVALMHGHSFFYPHGKGVSRMSQGSG